MLIYTVKNRNIDNVITHPLRTAKKEKLPAIKERFLNSGVNIVEELEKEDKNLFETLWKTEDIFCFGFAGFSCGEKDLGWGNKGEKYPLSYQGKFVGYWGNFNNHSHGRNFINNDLRQVAGSRGAS